MFLLHVRSKESSSMHTLCIIVYFVHNRAVFLLHVRSKESSSMHTLCIIVYFVHNRILYIQYWYQVHEASHKKI